MAALGKKLIGFYLLLYTCALLYLHFAFEEPFTNYLITFAILGVGFSAAAIFFTKDLTYVKQKDSFKRESFVVAALILWIVFYITYGGTSINKLLPATWVSNEQINTIVIFLRKLLFFVIVPFTVYRAFAFSLPDFGLKNAAVKLFSKRSITIFVCLSIAGLLFQYFLGNGGKTVQAAHFSTQQFIIGIPLCFIYLLFDAGLIEEFFFRGFLQGRLTALLKSETGAIVVSAIIFGLVHAPGLYLRGAGNEGIEEQLPFFFFASYTIVYMSIAGIFLGIIYCKTKNIWLVMALHAMLDLIPNLAEFIHTWHV